MALITYQNKVASNTNSGVADINKVKAEDMNEIKSVVNTNYNDIIGEIFFANGDTYTSADEIYVGNITGSTRTVQFTIPLPKRTDNITSATISDLTIIMRGISGYLNSTSTATNYVGASGYTVSVQSIGKQSITLALVKSSAFTNTTNNTPVVVYCSSCSMSFA